MAADDRRFPMSFFRMAHGAVSSDLAAHLAMVPWPLTGLHMGLRMRGGVASDILAADVADWGFYGGVDGDALCPRGLVRNLDLFRFPYPDLLRGVLDKVASV